MEFIDLKKQYQLIKPSIHRRLEAIFDRAGFIMGREIPELEDVLANYTNTKHCVVCSSGTDALLLALMAYGIGPGDAVFTTPFTFFSTAEVIALLGATPVFADIDPKTYIIDAGKLRREIIRIINDEKITGAFPRGLKPKGILAVDLFGLCADYDALGRIAKEFGLFLIEDAAQSFGAKYKGSMACGLGDIAATSFFPAKPLGCYGDGGAVFFNDEQHLEPITSLRIHGQGVDRYENVRIGINGRMDTMQAAVLLAKMEIFEGEIQGRQAVAQRYSRALKTCFGAPVVPEGYRSAWAQYSILSENRDSALSVLKSKAIPAAIYYPKPLHLQKAFGFLGYEKGAMPVSEEISRKIFSIPMHPYLEESDQDLIIGALEGVG